MAAILDFSDCSRIPQCYPPDLHYRGPKGTESTEKKTLSADAWYTLPATGLVALIGGGDTTSFSKAFQQVLTNLKKLLSKNTYFILKHLENVPRKQI